MTTNTLHICISENRRQDTVGVKLLVLSLVQIEPDARLHLFVDDMGEELKAWLEEFPQVVLEHLNIDPALGWNIKAKLFLKLLDDGLQSIVWIDSDIIVTAPIAHYFEGLSDDTMVTAEQYYTFSNRGTAVRTRGWGLPEGRNLPFTPNNCVMRVTNAHRPFLNDWQKLLDRPDYLAYQAGPWHLRPFYMMGSQDAMSALLGSSDYAKLPVKVIRRGRDIAQCFQADGYSPWERLANWWHLPPFVHAQGGKPWRIDEAQTLNGEVDAYWYAAKMYCDKLDTAEASWLLNRSVGARAMHILALGNPNLAGFPLALFALASKRFSAIMRLLKNMRD